jgi:hypothetical protein
VRRCQDIIKGHILDPGGEDNCSAAERSKGVASAGSRCGLGKILMDLVPGLPIWPEAGAIEEATPSENASDDHCGPEETLAGLKLSPGQASSDSTLRSSVQQRQPCQLHNCSSSR